MTRIGSLFSGYGGLDMAATAVLGGSVAWHSLGVPAKDIVPALHSGRVSVQGVAA